MNRWFSVWAAGLLAGIVPAVFSASAVESPPRETVPAAAASDHAPKTDLDAGDRAFAGKDYPVAVSFYTKYLQSAEKRQNKSDVKKAYERLLDALVMSRLPVLAEGYLLKYEKLYPANAIEIAMWRGDILFQQGKYAEAGKLYEKLLKSLPAQDPRRLRTLFASGQVLEKQGRWKEASERYGPLSQQAAGTPLGHQAFIRRVVCLAADNKADEAWELLLDHPPADRKTNAAWSMLAAYITLKQSGVEAASGAWRNLVRSLTPSSDADLVPLIYLTASSYGDAFSKKKLWADALLSYRAAFHAASDKNEMIETLNRIVAAVSQTGDKLQAANLAMSQLDLFKDSLLSPEVKLRTARLLREAGKIQGALVLYESVFANMNSSERERTQAVYEYSLLQARNGRLAEAEKTIHSYFRSDREAEGEFLLAEILVRLNRPNLYCPKFQEIARRWPDQAGRAWSQAALACLDHNQPDRALEFLEKLRTLPAGSADQLKLIYIEAAARTEKKQNAAALKLYNEFLKKANAGNPLIPPALYYSGLLAYVQQEMKLAAERLARFRKEYPDHPLAPKASVWLIQIYAVLNNVIAAERETWLLAERYPESEFAADALFRLASHYDSEGAREKATATLKKLAADTRFPRIQSRAQYEMAFQAFRRGEKKNALQLLSRLYDQFPDHPVLADGYYLNGDILRSESDFKSAIDFYQKAADRRPGSLLAMAAYGSMGDSQLAIASRDPAGSKAGLDTAISYYRKLRDFPRCPAVFAAMAGYRTGRCLELQGKREAASKEYRQVLFRFPASEAGKHPDTTAWCVRAAEALIDQAGKHPVRTTLRHARFALHWLADAGLIPLAEASSRFEKLKNSQFKP